MITCIFIFVRIHSLHEIAIKSLKNYSNSEELNSQNVNHTRSIDSIENAGKLVYKKTSTPATNSSITENQNFRSYEIPNNITTSVSKKSSPIENTRKYVVNQTLISTKRIITNSDNEAIKQPILCYEKDTRPRKAMRGGYWVLYNYIPGQLKLKCNETITYTTHCDHTFLDNVVPLLLRWQGPISIALYTPGSDYNDALKTVAYYRYICVSGMSR